MKKYILILCGILALVSSSCSRQWIKTDSVTTAPNSQEASTQDTLSDGTKRDETPFPSDPSDETEESSEPQADYILPAAQSHKYTAEELVSLTRDQLYLARNEIYARHGRIFKNNELSTYFGSREWYHGTIEPDAFDEGILNEEEKQNICLLKNLEQGIIITGRSVTKEAPYYKIFQTWENENPQRKVSARLYHDGTGNLYATGDSALIVHEDYYEVTDCTVIVDWLYPKSTFEGKKVGDRVIFEGEEVVISEIVPDENGMREITVIYLNTEEHSAELTPEGYVPLKRLREREDGFYSSEVNDICEPTEVLYEGSIYFYKDARIYTGAEKGRRLITAREYFESLKTAEENEMILDFGEGYTRAGGLKENGSIWMIGNARFDENYYAIYFEETIRNWVG